MIKKIFGITTLLFLSIFLIMPVYASEPNPFEKITDVYPGDLDYKNSLVDWNGYNLDLVMYWNKAGGLPPDRVTAFIYIDNVIVFQNGIWNNLGDSLFQLNLSESQKTIIKNVIFSRTYNSQNYFRISFTQEDLNTSNFLFEFRITFNSLLNINLGSVYIIDQVRQERTGMLNYFNKTVDIVGIENTIGGGAATFIQEQIYLDDETTQPIITSANTTSWTDNQLAQYNFIQKYTNVHALNFNFVVSMNEYDPRPRGNYYIHQLGFFADTQVILPDLDIDTDFQIYEPTICGILDLACVSRNLIGELSNTVYNRLGADNIASSILDIYDTLFYPVYIIENSAWQNAILAIYVMFPLGIIIMIIKRVT